MLAGLFLPALPAINPLVLDSPGSVNHTFFGTALPR
jgi:hypothetical protein